MVKLILTFAKLVLYVVDAFLLLSLIILVSSVEDKGVSPVIVNLFFLFCSAFVSFKVRSLLKTRCVKKEIKSSNEEKVESDNLTGATVSVDVGDVVERVFESRESLTVDSIHVDGQYRIVYGDGSGDVTERDVSNVRILSEDSFQAFCHLRNGVRTFMFARVRSIIDLKDGEITSNALELLSKRSPVDVGKAFNVDVTKRRAIVIEEFDDSRNVGTGYDISGEYDFTYTNSRTGVVGVYHISGVSLSSSRMYGYINNTKYQASVMLKKVSELVDCSTGELVTNDIAAYLRTKRVR